MKQDWSKLVTLNFGCTVQSPGGLLKHPNNWIPPQTNYIRISVDGALLIVTLKKKTQKTLQVKAMLSQGWEPTGLSQSRGCFSLSPITGLGQTTWPSSSQWDIVSWGRGFWRRFYNQTEDKRDTWGKTAPLTNQLLSFLHFHNPALLGEEVMLLAEATILWQWEDNLMK